MKTYQIIFSCVVLLLSATFASCSDKQSDFTGDWKTIAPLNVASDIYGADSAMEEIDLSFTVPGQGTDSDVTITGHYEIIRPMPADSTPGATVKATFSGTASCTGTWTYDVDDDDDVLLMFDQKSIAVEIESENVALSDSCSIPAMKLETFRREWKQEIENSFRATLSRFSVIEDVEVSKDGKTMKLEVHDPKAEIRFIRTM